MATWTTSNELQIGYSGKMFNKPTVKYQMAHVIPEGESKEETTLLEGAYKKLFETGFAKLKKEREKAIKKAMDDTEKAIAKKPPADMNKFIETANKLIEQGIKVWREVEVPRLAAECIEKVYQAVEKKLKRALNRKKLNCVLKVTALILITLAVGAVSIAATVLSGGAAAPIVLAAIGTGVGALISSVKIIKKEYDSYNGYLGKIEKDIEALNKAIEYQIKKEEASKWRKLGPKEKVKLLLSGTGGHAKSLRKHLADAEGRMILLRGKMQEAMVTADDAMENWKKMETSQDKNISAEAKAAYVEAMKTKRAFEKFQEKKQAFDELKAKALEQLDLLEKKGEWDGGKITKLIKFAEDHGETVSFLMDAGKKMFDGSKKIAKALAA